MALTSKERAALRSDAHHLNAVVHVGHQGVTPEVVRSLDEALTTQELVKIQLTKSADATVREAAEHMARETGSDIVQVIGRTATLYRHNPDLDKERKKGRRA